MTLLSTAQHIARGSRERSRGHMIPIVLGCAVCLSVLGILFVSSTTQGGRFEGLATRQAVWVLVGMGAMVAAILFDYRVLLKFSFVIYCVSLVPLVYLLFFGERIANGRLVSRRTRITRLTRSALSRWTAAATAR